MGVCRLQLIGAFVLTTPDDVVVPITSEKCRALIALIALAPSGIRSRSTVREFLWDSDFYPESGANLRRELSNLRRALTSAGVDELLITDNANVMLALDRLSVDVLDLESGHYPGSRAESVFLEGIDLAGSEEFEDWLRLQRQRIESLLDEVAREPRPLAFPAGEPPAAQSAAQRSFDPEVSIPPKPSLAVLPFEVLSDRYPQWWGISMFETVTAKLSDFPQLLVASSAAAARASRAFDEPREMAAKMGVAYLVEGSILPDAIGARVVVKLISGATNEQVWTRIFKAELKDDEGPGEQINSSIAHALWTAIDIQERDKFVRMSGQPQSNYERYWVANSLYRSWKPDDVARAAEISQDLVRNDPACPWANSLAGFGTALSCVFGSAADPEEGRKAAVEFAQAAQASGPDNVETLGYCAATFAVLDYDLDLADRIIAHALQILPDHQPTLFWGGWIDIARQDFARGRHRFQRSLQVNPISGARAMALCGIGAACLMEDDPGAALLHFEEALLTDPASPLAITGKQISASLANTPEMVLPKPASWSQAMAMLSGFLSNPKV